MIASVGIGLCVLLVHLLLAGAAIDLGPSRLGLATAISAVGIGLGVLSRARLPQLAEALALTLLIPARGVLCDVVYLVMPAGAAAPVAAAVVSLLPVSFALGCIVRRFVDVGLLPALGGFCLGQLAHHCGAVAYLPGPFTGFFAGALLLALVEMRHGVRGRHETGTDAPVGWEGFFLGVTLVFYALVLRRVLGAYQSPDLNPQAEVLLVLLIPAMLVAWPMSVLATPGWPARILAGIGALALGGAVLWSMTPLTAYTDGGKHAALSRTVNQFAIDWPVFSTWSVWLLSVSGPVAAALGLSFGAQRRRVLGPLLFGAAAALLVHEGLVGRSNFSVPTPLSDEQIGWVYRGPVTLLLLAAMSAAVAACVSVFGRKGLVAVVALLLAGLRVHGWEAYPEEYQLGFENVRRIGEFGVEAYGRERLADTGVFSTTSFMSAAPEAARANRSTFTRRELLVTLGSMTATSEPEEEHDHEDEPDFGEEGQPELDKYYGVRVGGTLLHAGHVATGRDGSTGRLTRLFSVPGPAFVTGIGSELLAADLEDAERTDVSSEVPFESRVLSLLLEELGLPEQTFASDVDPVDAARAASGDYATVMVAPQRPEWPGADVLLSREHIKRLAGLLAPGGRCLVWIDTTGMSARALRGRLAAFGSVFGRRSAAFVEPRELDAPFVLLVGWVAAEGAPGAATVGQKLPWSGAGGFRTRLGDAADLAALLLRAGAGMEAAADDWVIHRRGRPIPTGAVAPGGWAAVAAVVEPSARLESAVTGLEGESQWSDELLAGLVAHGDYSYHLQRLRSTVVETVDDIDWDAFEREWRHYEAASGVHPDHPVLAHAVASLIEPLAREQHYTHFSDVFKATGAGTMNSWRLALLEAYVRRVLLDEEWQLRLERARGLAEAAGVETGD